MTAIQNESTGEEVVKPTQPIVTIHAAVHPGELRLGSPQPSTRIRRVKFLQYTIGICTAANQHQVIVITKQHWGTVFESVSKWWEKWLARGAAFILWVVYFSALVSEPGLLGHLLARSDPAAATWEWPILGILTACLLVIAWALGVKRGGKAAAYVAFFPLIALVIFFTQAFGAINVIRLTLKTLGSLSVSGANWILLFVACVVVDRSTQPLIIGACAAFLFTSASYVVFSNFHWVTTPFQSILDISRQIQTWAISQITTTNSAIARLQQEFSEGQRDVQHDKKTEIIKKAETVHTHAKYAQLLSTRANALKGGRVFLFYMFAFRFLLALFAIITCFSGIFRAIHKLSPGSFGDKGIGSLWYGFYYSVVTFFTVGDGSVSPSSTLAQAAVVVQILFAVLTLTVLALSFSTLSIETAKENTVAIEEIAAQHHQFCMSVMENRLGTQATNPAEALEELKTNFTKCIQRSRRLQRREDTKHASKPIVEDDATVNGGSSAGVNVDQQNNLESRSEQSIAPQSNIKGKESEPPTRVDENGGKQ